MKRDMDLIRFLLLDIEGEEKPDLSAYTEEQIDYHRYLLIDGDLVHGNVTWGSDAYGQAKIMHIWIRSMASKGHDFLDDARNDNVWQEAKKAIAEKGATVSLTVIQGLLIALTKQQFGL